MKSDITKNNDATVTIKVSLPANDFAGFRTKALKHLGEHTQIDGFRKGAIPENILEQHLGQVAILTQMAEVALDHHYPDLLKKHDIHAIGQPLISITKLAPENPFEATITTAILPKISLEDYVTSAKKIFGAPFKTTITQVDVDKTILEIRKQLYKETHKHDHADGEEHTHEEPKEADLPVIDDEQAKKMGANDLAHFNEELRKRMELEEELRDRDKRIGTLIDTLVASANITLPAIIIDSELNRMMAEMKANIEQAGIPFDQYLGHIKKTEDEIREEQKDAATKRASSYLILRHIAEEEKITVPEQELTNEIGRLTKLYPSTNVERIRAYVHDYMETQATIAYLEKMGRPVESKK
ncbi:MAG: trigger factor [bacterium]|nr:trigger factor [bacterium]